MLLKLLSQSVGLRLFNITVRNRTTSRTTSETVSVYCKFKKFQGRKMIYFLLQNVEMKLQSKRYVSPVNVIPTVNVIPINRKYNTFSNRKRNTF